MSDQNNLKGAWVSRETRLPDEETAEFPAIKHRVLTFSPAYPVGHEMRHRMMDARFVRVCFEATHWLDVVQTEPV